MPVQFHKHALAVKVYQSKESFTWDEADAMWKAAFGRPFKGPATRAELRASRKVPAEWVKLHASLKAQRKFAHKVNNEGHNLFPSFFFVLVLAGGEIVSKVSPGSKAVGLDGGLLQQILLFVQHRFKNYACPHCVCRLCLACASGFSFQQFVSGLFFFNIN